MKMLCYDKEAHNWNEALPMGNGRLGGMFFSGTMFDRIQLNEDTLWSGRPDAEKRIHSQYDLQQIRDLIDQKKYKEAELLTEQMMFGAHSQAYLCAGDVTVELKNNSGTIRNYRRELDLKNAVLYSSYLSDNCEIKKEAFVSHPDQVLVYRICVSQESSFLVRLSSELRHQISATDNTIVLDGVCPTDVSQYEKTVCYDGGESILFSTGVSVRTDGISYGTGSSLCVENATELLIYLAITTSFNGYDMQPVSQGKEYKDAGKNMIQSAMNFSYEELKSRHIEDYKSLFNRVKLSLGKEPDICTDIRIKNPDLNMTELLFDYGRYLMISCSREGTQASNLQGIWNDQIIPPWHSNYTMNINTQMNYWPAESCNLSECHMPFFDLISDLCKKGNCFGYEGWASWHNSDLWRFNYEATQTAKWGFWPWGGFWSCLHIWEHYLYTQDREFLKKHFYILETAVRFLKKWLVLDEKGYYCSYPSTSPENAFVYLGDTCSITKNSAMDLSIAKDILSCTAKACTELGLDEKSYLEFYEKIHPLTVGHDGRLLEYNEEFEEAEKGHRHVSHLYGVFPGESIEEDSLLFEAALKSLSYRLAHGGGHTGWSNAWIANLYAVFKNGEKVYHYVLNMFERSIYPNMLCTHPPFQIDGNFGITQAISLMLLQSVHKDSSYELHILPAIPKTWSKGQVVGLRAKGGFELSIYWENERIKVSVDNLKGNVYRLVVPHWAKVEKI